MASAPVVIFDPVADDVPLPVRHTAQSAGYDVAAYLRGSVPRLVIDGAVIERAPEGDDPPFVRLEPGQRALIPLGFRARIPDGYQAEIRPRSGSALRKGLEIPNAPGTVDADYNGEWMVVVKNGSDRPMTIEHGERIAQMVVMPYVVVEFERGSVGRSTERDGGFGSTDPG